MLKGGRNAKLKECGEELKEPKVECSCKSYKHGGICRTPSQGAKIGRFWAPSGHAENQSARIRIDVEF